MADERQEICLPLAHNDTVKRFRPPLGDLQLHTWHLPNIGADGVDAMASLGNVMMMVAPSQHSQLSVCCRQFTHPGDRELQMVTDAPYAAAVSTIHLIQHNLFTCPSLIAVYPGLWSYLL
jgi:hypothetical protein